MDLPILPCVQLPSLPKPGSQRTVSPAWAPPALAGVKSPWPSLKAPTCYLLSPVFLSPAWALPGSARAKLQDACVVKMPQYTSGCITPRNVDEIGLLYPDDCG